MVQAPTPVETFFEKLTAWVGSIPSLVLHTCAFLGSFAVAFLGYAPWDMVLLIVTTIVSLEAIYLSIFIQMTVNRQAKAITEVSEDVEEISEDVEGIQEDVEAISKDVDEIQEDVEEISEDVEGIQEDVEEMSEDWNLEDGKPRTPETATLDALHDELKSLVIKIEEIRRRP